MGKGGVRFVVGLILLILKHVVNGGKLMQITNLIKLGKLIKEHNVAVNISYGSGGFCVVLKTEDNKNYASYSWSLIDCFELAFAKMYYEDPQFDFDDEPTKPDVKIDTTYKIIK